MANPRKIAVSVLLKIENDGAYSNLILSQTLKNTDLDNKDKSLVSALVYGVLDRKITLDYILGKFMKTPVKKTAPFTLCVLRVALYQIMYMDKIPDSAAVNEAVKLVKNSKENRNSGFVNGVLRQVLRSEISLPQDDSISALSVRYSCPVWIIESFIADYGTQNAKALLDKSLEAAPITLRINTILSNAEEVENCFKNENIKTKEGLLENSLDISGGTDISKCYAFGKGYIYVQDIASQKAVSVLAPKSGDRVLDMCAAPGSKSFTMAQYMENSGEIIACDLHPHRVELIEKSADRLGIKNIKPMVQDATVYNKDLGEFDCILCDVPCSGLGVLRRKPDIKYGKSDNFAELAEIQYKILCNAVKYLKKGGRILYSTCTLRSEENEKLVIRFQKEYNGFCKVYEHTFMPHVDGTDGFYCALLEMK